MDKSQYFYYYNRNLNKIEKKFCKFKFFIIIIYIKIRVIIKKLLNMVNRENTKS
jgi:hypothetical protein